MKLSQRETPLENGTMDSTTIDRLRSESSPSVNISPVRETPCLISICVSKYNTPL